MSTASQDRFFTIEEANAMIPQLQVRFGRILQMRTQLRSAHHALEQFGEPPSPESLRRQDGSPELRSTRGKFRALMEALREEVQAIDQAGVEVKDLDTGLCDFRSKRAGREVYLCWQYGEKSVGYWHDLGTGFGGRQPVEETPPVPQILH